MRSNLEWRHCIFLESNLCRACHNNFLIYSWINWFSLVFKSSLPTNEKKCLQLGQKPNFYASDYERFSFVLFSGFKLIEFWFDMSPLGIWYITLLGFFHISKMLIQFQLWKWNCENVFFDNFSNFVAVICLWNLWEFFHVKVSLS